MCAVVNYPFRFRLNVPINFAVLCPRFVQIDPMRSLRLFLKNVGVCSSIPSSYVLPSGYSGPPTCARGCLCCVRRTVVPRLALGVAYILASGFRWQWHGVRLP